MNVAGYKHSDCINREIALFIFLFFFSEKMYMYGMHHLPPSPWDSLKTEPSLPSREYDLVRCC